MISFERRVSQAEEIFGKYELGKPFSLFLKQHFKTHKKYGSRDRREIGQVLFSVLRSSILAKNESFKNKAAIGLVLQDLPPKGFPKLKSFIEKLDFLSSEFSLSKEFLPLSQKISSTLDLSSIEKQLFSISPIFFRLYGYEKKLVELANLQIEYNKIASLCYAAEPNSKVSNTKAYKKGIIDIQDYSSQRVIDFLDVKEGEKWWDCCCGSGGKSALFLQKYTNANLYCSDSRSQILKNLDLRLKRLKLKPKSVFRRNIIDDQIRNTEKYDGVIADVPCTGSGTFSRNPEQMLSIDSNLIEKYTKKQFDIVSNAAKALKTGGKLVYITCSIYKDENETQIQKIASELGFKPEKEQYIYSPRYQSDQLFIALLNKS